MFSKKKKIKLEMKTSHSQNWRPKLLRKIFVDKSFSWIQNWRQSWVNPGPELYCKNAEE